MKRFFKKSTNSNVNEPVAENSKNEIIQDKIFYMKWFYFYSYILLPVLTISMLARINRLESIESYIALMLCVYLIITLIGLYLRRLWGWKMNWVILVFLTLQSPIQGIKRISYLTGLVIMAYIWLFPNYIYFKKRKHLFYKKKTELY
jgi:hypothetical protein